MTTLTSGTYRDTVPGHSLLAQTGRLLRQAGLGLWTALEAAGQRRAARHLLDSADRCERFNPSLAEELRRAAGRGLQG